MYILVQMIVQGHSLWFHPNHMMRIGSAAWQTIFRDNKILKIAPHLHLLIGFSRHKKRAYVMTYYPILLVCCAFEGLFCLKKSDQSISQSTQIYCKQLILVFACPILVLHQVEEWKWVGFVTYRDVIRIGGKWEVDSYLGGVVHRLDFDVIWVL